MTRSTEDLLAVYLLAKYAGFFLDRDARETCACRIVPLFELIFLAAQANPRLLVLFDDDEFLAAPVRIGHPLMPVALGPPP